MWTKFRKIETMADLVTHSLQMQPSILKDHLHVIGGITINVPCFEEGIHLLPYGGEEYLRYPVPRDGEASLTVGTNNRGQSNPEVRNCCLEPDWKLSCEGDTQKKLFLVCSRVVTICNLRGLRRFVQTTWSVGPSSGGAQRHNSSVLRLCRLSGCRCTQHFQPWL